METSAQTQYSKFGGFIKKLLHTKIGAKIGYNLGISGFNRIDPIIIRSDGTVEHLDSTYNSRVDKGAALTASLMSGSALGSITSPLPPIYIALSTSSLSAVKGDTTLSGETVVTGLGRAVGAVGGYSAPASLDGSASYTITKTFTAGVVGPTVIQSAALFDAVSTGNMFVEANLSASASLGQNDTLAITWTVNV